MKRRLCIYTQMIESNIPLALVMIALFAVTVGIIMYRQINDKG